MIKFCCSTTTSVNEPLNVDIGHLTLQVLDFWHPYEKAAYPEYFARREVRKREFVERWEKKYGQKVDFGHEWK